jgi:hypothetical protein
MSCANRNVHLDNRLQLDDCALSANEKQNNKMDKYHLYNPRVDCNDKKYMKVASCNNMVVNNGYGNSDSCNIDIDSRLRNGGEITNKQTLNKNFRKCGSNNCEDDKNSTENRMRRGNDFGLKRCDTVSESSTLDLHLTPMIKCLQDNIQNTNHIVPTWTWGGEPTRDALKQKEFLEEQGFRFTNGVANQSCGFN